MREGRGEELTRERPKAAEVIMDCSGGRARSIMRSAISTSLHEGKERNR